MNDERLGRISASGAAVTYACPGSLRMQAGLKSQSTPESLEGDAIHAALATGEFDGLDETGKTIAIRLQNMLDDALAAWGRPNPRIVKEVRLWLYGDDYKPIISAKPDWFAISGNKALCIDVKSGYLPTTRANRNIQLRIQSLCLSAEFPNLTEIVAAIAQYRFSKTFDPVTYGPKELAQARAELDFHLALATDPEAPLYPGEWCRFCPAKPICPAAGAYALLPVTTVAPTGIAITKDNVNELVRSLTIEQQAAIRKRKRVIELIFKAIDDSLRALPIDELNKAGLTIGKAARMMSIEDAPMAQQILVDAKLITREEFETCVKVVGGRVEDLIVDRIAKNEGLTVTKAKQRMWQILLPSTRESFRTAPLRALEESNE